MNKPLFLVLALGLSLGATAAHAGNRDRDGDRDEELRQVDEHRPLKANARVEVSNVAGSITVETWDRNELHLTGELSEEVEKLEITGDDSNLRIEVKLPKRNRNVEDTILNLKVPAGITLEADAVSADVQVRGVRGDVDVHTVSGEIDLEVGSKNVEARTVSGDVTVEAPAATARIESVSGDISVRAANGEVRGETVSGNVDIRAKTARRVDLKSVSGDLEIEAELGADSEVEAETMSGDIRLTLPRLPEASMEVETYSGRVDGGDLLTKSGGGSREGTEYWRKGSGSGRVRLHSFSGDIDLQVRSVSDKRTVEKRVEKD